MRTTKNSLIRIMDYYTKQMKELEEDPEPSGDALAITIDTLKLLLELKEYRFKDYLKSQKKEPNSRLKENKDENEQ